MSAASADSTDPKMATIVNQPFGDHSKLFVALYHRVDLLFPKTNYGDWFVVPEAYW